MEIYKFKCKCCGATKYNKLNDTTYQCSYCGNTEEIIQKKVETIIVKQVETTPQTNTQLAEKKEAFVQAIINLLIVLFAGWFGIHKFLKGRIFLGIVYIFTYGLFGVGIFIDSIKALINLVDKAKEYRTARG